MPTIQLGIGQYLAQRGGKRMVTASRARGTMSLIFGLDVRHAGTIAQPDHHPVKPKLAIVGDIRNLLAAAANCLNRSVTKSTSRMFRVQ